MFIYNADGILLCYRRLLAASTALWSAHGLVNRMEERHPRHCDGEDRNVRFVKWCSAAGKRLFREIGKSFRPLPFNILHLISLRSEVSKTIITLRSALLKSVFNMYRASETIPLSSQVGTTEGLLVHDELLVVTVTWEL